jgi:SPP1 family predicted phage head-tail adaptor
MLTPSQKSELLTHVRDTITRDTDGSEIRTPATLRTIYAEVKPVTSREWFAAQQTQSSASYRVRIDYLEDVRAEDRFTWGTVTLQVVGEPMLDRAGWTTTAMCSVLNA